MNRQLTQREQVRAHLDHRDRRMEDARWEKQAIEWRGIVPGFRGPEWIRDVVRMARQANWAALRERRSGDSNADWLLLY